jgi:fatty-acyl-CoA synthase
MSATFCTWIRTTSINFIQAWGMTETNPLGTVAIQLSKYKHKSLTPSEQFKNVVPAGLPLPGLQLKIVDSEDFDKELPRDGEAVGELLIRGPWITASYFNNPEASADPTKFYKGWLVTGDMCSIDKVDTACRLPPACLIDCLFD